MSKVVFGISMSLDGLLTAANVRPEQPVGDGGQQLHEWAMSGTERVRARCSPKPGLDGRRRVAFREELARVQV
jgi:hypothetical protein